MTPNQLAEEVASVVERAQGRIKGVGADQYHDGSGRQKFENLEISELVEYSIEESLDFVNYGAMLTLRLDDLKAAMETGSMDLAADSMIRWIDSVMPDASGFSFVDKMLEEVGELIGFKIEKPEGWNPGLVDLKELPDCVLCFVAIAHKAGINLGLKMHEKMAINRSRKQVRQPDGTYHHVTE